MNRNRIYYRNKEYQFSRFINILFISVLTGWIYFNVFSFITKKIDTSTQTGVNSKISAIFMMTLFLGMETVMSVIPMFLNLRPIFYRETLIKLYHPGTIPLIVVLTELPYLLALLYIFW